MMSTAKRRKPGERSPREKRIASRAKADERSRCIRIVWSVLSDFTDIVKAKHGDWIEVRGEVRGRLVERMMKRTTHPEAKR